MIKKKIKYIITVFIVTVIVYVTYDNLQNIDAGRSLPVGVSEVELTNWTKTREPNEINNGEKKLNSHSDLAELNKNIDQSDVENIKDLYDSKNNILRGINYVTIVDEVDTSDTTDTDTADITNATSIRPEIPSSNEESKANEEILYDKTGVLDSEEALDSEKATEQYSTEEISDSGDTPVEDIVVSVGSESEIHESMPKVVVEDNETPKKVTGNKILRTIVSPEKGGIIRYDLSTLYGYLKSDKPIDWQDGKFVTWDLYTSLDPENQKASIEWRMLSAKFNISQEQYNLLRENEAYAVLGVPSDNEYGFELIVPYNDIISVFINKSLTSLNYQNRNTTRIYNLNGSETKYKASLLSKCKNPTDHKGDLSKHTDFYHIECGVFNSDNFMETNISKDLKLGENTIDFLVGNFISSESVLNNSYGFSKLNLYIIEKPQLDINVQFYKYRDGKIVYFDENYLPTNGDNVYARIDIKNTSDKFILNNLDLYIKITKTPLKINKNTITYNNINIKNNTRCYINDDFSQEYGIDKLQTLNCGDKITIMSDKIVYSITKNDAIRSAVVCSGNLKMNYVRDDFTHIEFRNNQTAIRVPVSSSCGTLNFTCDIENEDGMLENSNNDDQSFMINVSNDDESANLVIKPGQTYTVKNLNIDSTYYINLILPQNYIIVDTDTYSSSNQNKVQMDATDDYSEDIHIKLKRKNNSYFYKNKQNDVDLSFK